MTDCQKRYIENNIESIIHNEWNEFFDGLSPSWRYGMGNIFHVSDIEFLSHIQDIPPNLFYCCDELEHIVIPDNVRSIGESAFQRCCNLKSALVSDNVECIKRNAFFECTDLINANLPAKLTTIDQNTFYSCKSLSTIVIPESVKIIKSQAFANCTQLNNISYTGTKEQWSSVDIEESAFFKVPQYNIRCSDGVTKLRH